MLHLNRKMTVSLITGFVISGVAMYFSFRNIPFRELVLYLKTIDYLWLVPATAVVIASYVARVVRWRILAAPVAKIGLIESFNLTMTGFMLNCIMPARIGEVVRPAALKKKYGVPFTAGFATVVTERIFDMIFLIVFLAICLAFVNISPETSYKYNEYTLNRETIESIAAGMLKMCILVIIMILAVCFEKTRNLISRIISYIPPVTTGIAGEKAGGLAKRFISRPAESILQNVASGFQAVKSFYQVVVCTGLSILVWTLLAFSYYVFSKGCPGMNLGMLEISAVMVIICFVIALPSVPGFWGIWEAGSIFALSIFGVAKEPAAGFSLANHALQIFPVVIVGIISAISIGFGAKNLEEAETLVEAEEV